MTVSDDASGWREYPPLELHPLLALALDEIVEHGYDGTSVRKIANRAGVTVPALYYHFENKQAMLRELLDHAMRIVLTHARAALDEAGADCTARLGALVEAIVLYTAHHRDLAFLDSERRSLTPENRAHYVAQRDELEGELRDAIRGGVAQGVFRTPHPDECGRAILSMCQGVAGWFRPGGPVDEATMARRYADLALATVQHQKGTGR
ncbi:TetR/AcrR family transcriptional regulator [Dactylosporangium sp. CA-152071]|uniref:TetR/AcrR family transcriptional regulator n=1 Tax=Dactylosporangium sp. CA-152071 TaxID=3239933 RepID=UPI003D8A18C5